MSTFYPLFQMSCYTHHNLLKAWRVRGILSSVNASLQIDLTPSTDDQELKAEFRIDQQPSIEVTIVGNVPLAHDGTPWLAPATVVAMRIGADLSLPAADQIALDNAERAQSVLASWFEELRPIEVRTEPNALCVPSRRGVGCFFSGGVDSFYSALRHDDAITHLIFVRGFDIPFTDDDLGERAATAARAAAAALGKQLIELRTNIRRVSDPIVSWGEHFHGAALAMAGLALAPHLSEIIIPASYYEADLFPWGSHPVLDPLWSSSAVTFIHDGVETTRPHKVAAIAQHQVALEHLRVCWRNPHGAYNCGRCEKCLRTMVNLRAVGALESCRTLPRELDPRAISRIHLDHGGRVFATENLRAIRDSDRRDEELEWALRTAIRRSRTRSNLGYEVARRVGSRVKRSLLSFGRGSRV